MTGKLSEKEIRRISEYFDAPGGREVPLAIWIIGRPAAGKTTTATLLRDALRRMGRHVELVDGQSMRELFDGRLGYSEAERVVAFQRLIDVNKFLQSRGIIPITATIGGLRRFRHMARLEVPNVRFVFLDCPFDVAAKRDPKGLYAKALAGEVKNFFGVDLVFETPIQCDLVIDSTKFTAEAIVDRIVEYFVQGRFYSPPRVKS